MTVFNVCASICIADSLVEGKSRFLAEVERLRESIRATEGGRPVLFLIDEILGGTNSRDRRIAAESAIGALVAAVPWAHSRRTTCLDRDCRESRLRGVTCTCRVRIPSFRWHSTTASSRGFCYRTNALAIVRMMAFGSIDPAEECSMDAGSS